VHESGSTTDESFIHFDLLSASAEFHEVFVVHCKADSVKHEPSGLLSDAESTGNFVGANAVLAIRNHPHGQHPFVHAQRGVFKDGSDLEGELLFASFTEPYLARGDERVFRRLAAWTRNLASGPTQHDRILKRAVRVREENHGFLQGIGKLGRLVHE